MKSSIDLTCIYVILQYYDEANSTNAFIKFIKWKTKPSDVLEPYDNAPTYLFF